jgi:hypothetical protein
MLIHETDYHLQRLAQNATALRAELRKEHDAEPVGATQRPALIDKLRTKMREDITALELGGA